MKEFKTFILLMTGVAVQAASGQNIQLKVDNTEPRMWQEITLTIETRFFEEFLKSTFTDSIELKQTYSNKDLKKTIIPKRLGLMTIGPIQFDFNGVTYFSNSITINVISNLSDEKGVWIRKLRIDTADYIVIEQISTIKPVITSSPNTWNTEWKATQENLAKLIKEPDDDDIEFFQSRSGMGGHPDKSKGYPPSISYSYKFYEIRKGSKFKGNFKLKERHFESLPKGTKIPDIVIN